MSTTVALKDDLARRLKLEADAQRTTVDSVANGLLERLFPPLAVNDDAALSAIVTTIRNTPPDPTAIRPAQKIPDYSLLLPEDSEGEFNEPEWNRQWAEVESTLKARSLLNEMAEGRG